jgi:mycofactocin glycosyltransferase
MRYLLAPEVRLQESAEGIFLVAARPLRMVRINGALLCLVRQMAQGAMTPASEGARRSLEELARRGFVQRVRGVEDRPSALPLVSIVIPVKDRAGELRHCLTSLAALDYPAELLEVIVVDDGSTDDSAAVARNFGATVLPSGGRGRGPAAARNRGAAAARGELLAFIDSDCTAAPSWLQDLVGTFLDPQVAAVGGLVDGLHNASALDRYEAVMSSLTLGGQERSGQEGNDTFYLPSCNLLVRRSAFEQAGGFRSEMHVGEDVDLTWRLRDADGKIVYLPRGQVFHEHRSRLGAFMRRRFDYGTSEGLLQTLHPARRKKMALPGTLTTIFVLLLLALAGRSFLPLLPAVTVWWADAGLTRYRMHGKGIPLPYLDVLLARGRAVGSLAYYLGYHLLRYYLLALLLVVAFFPASSLALLAIILWVGGVDYYVRKPRLGLAPFYLFYLLEQLAYGGGVFWGSLKQKNFSNYSFQISHASS